MTRGELTTTAWRKSKTSPKSSVMVVNVLAVACFALPGFAVFSSSALMVITLSSSLSSFSPLAFYPSFAHYVMEQAKIFKSLPASDSLWRIAASASPVPLLLQAHEDAGGGAKEDFSDWETSRGR